MDACTQYECVNQSVSILDHPPFAGTLLYFELSLLSLYTSTSTSTSKIRQDDCILYTTFTYSQ